MTDSDRCINLEKGHGNLQSLEMYQMTMLSSGIVLILRYIFINIIITISSNSIIGMS